MQPSKFDKLTWVLIFGGMVSITLGLTLLQSGSALGWMFTVAGAVAVAVGVVMIFVRSRRARPD